ncbi:MAG: Ail and OmpX [Vibrio sp.]|uniref:Ail and OmpX n=1 Tax=Vibrio sp. TaxID=678 RepID=UPI003A8BDB27
MKIWAVFITLVLLSSSVFSHELTQVTPLRYDYIYGSVSSGSYRSSSTDGDNASSVIVGINHKFADGDLLWSADYGSRFVHPNDLTIDHYLFRVGLGYRWSLAGKLDLVTNGKVGALRIDAGDKETDFVYSVDLGLRYAVTEKFETSLFAEALRNKWLDENNYTFSGDYYLYPKFALGGFVSYRDGERGSSIREAGILAKFSY